ncbi:hypothetical protein GCM10017687_34510 [Streptomyces echinatus]
MVAKCRAMRRDMERPGAPDAERTQYARQRLSPGFVDRGEEVVGAGFTHAVQAEQLLPPQGEQVGEIGDQARVDELDDAGPAQALDVELVPAGGIGERRDQMTVAALGAPPAFLARGRFRTRSGGSARGTRWAVHPPCAGERPGPRYGG